MGSKVGPDAGPHPIISLFSAKAKLGIGYRGTGKPGSWHWGHVGPPYAWPQMGIGTPECLPQTLVLGSRQTLLPSHLETHSAVHTKRSSDHTAPSGGSRGLPTEPG